MKPIDPAHSIRAQDHIAQGALTNSKRPECFVRGVYHTHAERGHGAFIEDASGKNLFDFICGLGSNILGYGNATIATEVYKHALRGPSLSLSSTLELKLAEKIKEVIPWVQKMRFLKTGSDACTAALRMARAYNSRGLVLSEGYHGWHDEFVSLTPPAAGVKIDPPILKLGAISSIDSSVAAVIVEPIMTDISPGRVQWLRDLRKKCDDTGAVLIFDEVITGFRTPKFTMSSYFGIEPDIICLGKAMANGFPISVVAGREKIMNGSEYFVSSTFAGEMCSIGAAIKCIDMLQTNKFDLKELWEAGEYFLSRFNSMYPEKIKIIGYPTRGVFQGEELTKALLWQEAYLADILLGSSFFINFAHIPYLDRVLSVLHDIIVRIKTGSVELKGEMPKSPFAQKMREMKCPN